MNFKKIIIEGRCYGLYLRPYIKESKANLYKDRHRDIFLNSESVKKIKLEDQNTLDASICNPNHKLSRQISGNVQ